MMTHMAMDVEGALRNKMFKGFTFDDGKPMPPARVKAELMLLRHKGVKLIPLGKCDNFDPENGCRGHQEEDK